MSPTPERMSRVDTAWLRMDCDANLMMIVGIWLLRPRLTVEQVSARVQERLLQYTRFRQKVVHDTMGASWVEDEDFDISRHVVKEVLKPRRGQPAEEALKQRVGELAAEPLDPDRPLWQFRVVEEMDGQSVLIARIHHCIADGIALMSVLFSITDGGKAPPEKAQRPEAEHDFLSDALLKPLTDLMVKAIGMTGTAAAKSMETLARPAAPAQASADVLRMGYQALSDVTAFAMMPDDSRTSLKGKPNGRKHVAWGEPLPLDAVKAAGKALGCSINDVLLSCAAGAIGSYLQAQGDDPAGKEIRAMVPVNLRPLEKAYQLGNRFGLVPLVLPVGIANPIERLYEVRKRMSELKGSYQPLLAFGLLSLAGLFIKPVQNAMLNLFAKKTTAVMTNVPGPSNALKFCGASVERLMFWVPQSGDVGIGVSILTYAGNVQFGLITDDALCPHPQLIIDRFQPEFNKLLVLALMLPWEA
ncbi:wax ester/triacylglycerol synthase family O-acyltransferase [Roseateles toxinivorans]|uniref:diacylglycerol O-acyltransferase n=1 Tax=Roseateles toxinivorans TaxID=270368 RepID=A0A4R6QNJ1_9BURK|nr:diacylglycerol O-acyltransferase [Roseateles toxinivorans]